MVKASIFNKMEHQLTTHIVLLPIITQGLQTIIRFKVDTWTVYKKLKNKQLRGENWQIKTETIWTFLKSLDTTSITGSETATKLMKWRSYKMATVALSSPINKINNSLRLFQRIQVHIIVIRHQANSSLKNHNRQRIKLQLKEGLIRLNQTNKKLLKSQKKLLMLAKLTKKMARTNLKRIKLNQISIWCSKWDRVMMKYRTKCWYSISAKMHLLFNIIPELSNSK